MKQTEGAAAGPDKAADWVDRSHRLMAWAVTAAERRATYIGSLRTDQTGLACQCVCPACGGQLQAVNAGKSLQDLPAGKSLRPHFRHHTGQQQDSCLVRTSQLVALQLLVQEKVIHLPAQTSRWTVGGASGQMYTGTATSAGFAARIVERQWVDEQEAKITLDNGRVVWLRLFGTTGVGVPDSGDGVVTVKVDDPEVATWPIEKILQYAQLTGAWMCWEKHWQDSELEEQARLAAEKEAQHWCDQIPDDLDLPEGLTPAQRSESVLHWLIKGMLSQAQHLATPEHRETVTRFMPDSVLKTSPVYLGAAVYRISNVRLEHRLKRVIPDVICTAARGHESMDLMIEVAVTHKVDQAKRERIHELGLACLEIDTHRLGQSGRVSVDELRDMVLKHTRNKTWIHHPALEKLRLSAQRDLEHLYNELQLQGKREAERQLRITFLQERMGDEELLHQYMRTLREAWKAHGNQTPQRGEYHQHELVDELMRRRLFRLDGAEFIGKNGVLWMLDAIAQGATAQRALAMLQRCMDDASPSTVQQYASVVGMAVVNYVKPLGDEHSGQLQALRERATAAVEQGDYRFSRPKDNDRALAIWFPDLQTALASGKGTVHMARQRHFELAEMKRRRKWEEQEQESRLLAEQECISKVREHIDWLARTHVWLPRTTVTGSVDATIDHASKTLTDRDVSYDPNWQEIVRTAWTHREEGRTLEYWLASQPAASEWDVSFRVKILEKVGLLYNRQIDLRALT